ncbi:MAG TPA: DUF1272 domain-containing protein [Caldimonas sp.]|jgi:hypothetical protein
MLQLRPSCEHCNVALPPDSTAARICSFECTFCADCVRDVLLDVCPNCGGAFQARPIRPRRNWRGDNDLGHHPASTTVRHRPVDGAGHRAFAAAIASLAPHER